MSIKGSSYHQKKRYKLTCQSCGSKFVSSRRDAKWCDASCRHYVWLKNRQAAAKVKAEVKRQAVAKPHGWQPSALQQKYRKERLGDDDKPMFLYPVFLSGNTCAKTPKGEFIFQSDEHTFWYLFNNNRLDFFTKAEPDDLRLMRQALASGPGNQGASRPNA